MKELDKHQYLFFQDSSIREHNQFYYENLHFHLLHFFSLIMIFLIKL